MNSIGLPEVALLWLAYLFFVIFSRSVCGGEILVFKQFSLFNVSFKHRLFVVLSVH